MGLRPCLVYITEATGRGGGGIRLCFPPVKLAMEKTLCELIIYLINGLTPRSGWMENVCRVDSIRFAGDKSGNVKNGNDKLFPVYHLLVRVKNFHKFKCNLIHFLTSHIILVQRFGL